MPWPRVVSDAQSTLRSAAVCTPPCLPFWTRKNGRYRASIVVLKKNPQEKQRLWPARHTVLLGLQIGQLREYSMRLLIPTAE